MVDTNTAPAAKDSDPADADNSGGDYGFRRGRTTLCRKRACAPRRVFPPFFGQVEHVHLVRGVGATASTEVIWTNTISTGSGSTRVARTSEEIIEMWRRLVNALAQRRRAYPLPGQVIGWDRDEHGLESHPTQGGHALPPRKLRVPGG